MLNFYIRIFSILLASVLPVTQAQAQADGLPGKVIVGYQGWFGCPNDFENNQNWQHWFVNQAKLEFLTVDMLPDLSAFGAEDLCDTGLPTVDRQGTVKLFSSQNPKIVLTHFRWMQAYGIDVAAVQRFVSELSNPKQKRRADNMLKNVMLAAQASQRSFFVVYDISGANPNTVINDIRQDWQYLVNQFKVTASPAYLKDKAKPVLELWGFGFSDRPGASDEVMTLQQALKQGQNQLTAVTLIGGVPTHWRSLSGDSKSQAGWHQVYRNYDVISPWTVGRFSDEYGADLFFKNIVLADVIETKRLGLQYMPVIFPGFSWHNLMINHHNPSRAILNQIPRRCGQLIKRQIDNLLKLKINSLYVAMFDEVDEATAMFPVETGSGRLPAGAKMVYLNQDGCDLPSDWYLQILNNLDIKD